MGIKKGDLSGDEYSVTSLRRNRTPVVVILEMKSLHVIMFSKT